METAGQTAPDAGELQDFLEADLVPGELEPREQGDLRAVKLRDGPRRPATSTASRRSRTRSSRWACRFS